MKFTYISVILINIVVSMSISTPISAQNYHVSAASDLARIFEDGYNMGTLDDTMKIFGIRGEIVSGQFVINALDDLSDITVEINTLTNIRSGNTLSSAFAEWNFVGSIPLTENNRSYPLSTLTRQAPAKFPDYLMEDKLIDVKKGSYQSVWITFNIPKTIEAGTYSTEVAVMAGKEQQKLPVMLIIYPLDMPEERHLNIVEWFNTRNFEKWHGIKEPYSEDWFAMLKKYADNMVAHRKNSFRVSMDVIGKKRSEEGNYLFDFTMFDKIAQLFWDTGKMDYMETGFLAMRGEEGWRDPNFRWKDIKVTQVETGEDHTLPGEEVIPSLVEAFESHLRQKGWLGKTWFHIQDEPVIWNSFSWIEFSRFIHKYAPDLIRMDAVETTWLLDDIEVVVPKLNHFASWYDTYRKAKEQGVEVWFYTVGIHQGSIYPNKTIDVPLIESRILHWMNYKYDAPGYLHWGWNAWTEDPFKEVGMHLGDGWHVYPARDGVLNSLRWEQMRNGIQDYEYLWMLENMVGELKDSLGSRFSWIDPKQRGKEISTRIIKGFSEYSKDPEILYEAKMEVIQEMLDFKKSPKVYIQTNPMEGPGLQKGSSVELCGWTEPGTSITVNGEKLMVNKQGLFVTKTDMRDGDLIRVQAGNSKGTKEIIRRVYE